MADMIGAVRSSVFRVTDVEAFKAWFARYKFGDEIELWIDGNEVAFGGYEYYPSASPYLADPVVDEDDEGADGYVEADLGEFAAGLIPLLEPDAIFAVMAAGNEKLRYVAGSILVVRAGHPPQFLSLRSSDPAGLAQAVGL